MKLRNIVAAIAATVIGSGAYAATFEASLVCDQDPREASTAYCVLYVPAAFEELASYDDSMFVTSYLLQTGDEDVAATGLDLEADASSEWDSTASVLEEETLPESMITDLQELRQHIIGPVQN